MNSTLANKSFLNSFTTLANPGQEKQKIICLPIPDEHNSYFS